MEDGGRMKGRGHPSVIDKMQKYYGRAIRENSSDLDKMKKVSGQFTILIMIKEESSSLEEQHKLCP